MRGDIVDTADWGEVVGIVKFGQYIINNDCCSEHGYGWYLDDLNKKYHDNMDMHWDEQDLKHYEVIGNIYENPELLEKNSICRSKE